VIHASLLSSQRKDLSSVMALRVFNQCIILQRSVDQVIYWRAHLNKIVAIEQVKDCDVLITASVDSSVR
jgi:hypothetical protein